MWRHIEDLAIGLDANGFSVTIGLLPRATELQDACSARGLRWKPLHETVGRATDIWHVHLNDTYDKRAFVALATRAAIGPSVITEHLPRNHASDPRLEPHHPRTRWAAEAKTAFKRFEFGLGTSVIAVGSSSASFIERRYSLAPGTVTTVHNGIDAAQEPLAPRRPDGPLRVVTVGSLGRQKGHDVLLEAIRRSSLDWSVTVVGSGAQLENLRSLAAGLEPDRVRFTGWIDDPRSEIANADVFCMPSRWESFPYAALEAGALGRPVVGSRVDGLDEIVVDGESGILVAPEQPDELSAALDRLAANPELVAEYGRAAHARIHTKFTLRRMLDGTIATYRRVQRRRMRIHRR